MAQPIHCSCGTQFPAEEAVCPKCGKPARSSGRSGKKWAYLTTALSVAAVIGIVIGFVYVMKQDTGIDTRRLSNYGGALDAVRTVHVAQLRYFRMYGKYAATLRALGSPATGPAGPEGAGLVSSSLANGERNGYRLELRSDPQGYTLRAHPLTGPSALTPGLYSDGSLAIHSNAGGPAGPDSPEIDLRED